MPPSSLTTVAAAVAAFDTMPAAGYAAEGGVAALACRRHARWRRYPYSWAPLRAGAPVGAVPSTGGSVRKAALAGCAASPGGHPCLVFARGSNDHKRRCPIARHHARAAVAGAAVLTVAAVGCL